MKKYQDSNVTGESLRRNKAIREKMIAKAKAKQQNDKLADKCCAHFGCGKKLSHVENLYSDYCFKHQRNEKTPKQEKHLF